MKPSRAIHLLLALFAASVISANLHAEGIRKFDLRTIEKLGSAIYEQDIRAAQATDILFSKKKRADLEKEGLCGWIVEGEAPQMTVLFLRQNGGKLEAAYTIKFSKTQKPVLEKCADSTVTERQRALYAARTLALKNIKRPCSKSCNIVTLPDPERDGFLVYALAATTEPNAVLVGGHYRFTISKDGTRIEQADELFKSCLILSKKPKDLPPGATLTALTMSTVIDDKPQETHVYLNLLHKLNFYVIATSNNSMWLIQKGKISPMTKG